VLGIHRLVNVDGPVVGHLPDRLLQALLIHLQDGDRLSFDLNGPLVDEQGGRLDDVGRLPHPIVAGAHVQVVSALTHQIPERLLLLRLLLQLIGLESLGAGRGGALKQNAVGRRVRLGLIGGILQLVDGPRDVLREGVHLTLRLIKGASEILTLLGKPPAGPALKLFAGLIQRLPNRPAGLPLENPAHHIPHLVEGAVYLYPGDHLLMIKNQLADPAGGRPQVGQQLLDT
jgi:hypothetical protein